MTQNKTKTSNQGININVPTIAYSCLNNKDWQMKSISGSCYDLMNCTADELLSNKVSFGQLILQDEVERVWEHIQTALKKHAPYQLIYHIKTPANVEKTLFEQGQGVYINEEIIELHGFISDVTPVASISPVNITSLFEELARELMQLSKVKFDNTNEYNLSNREIEVLVHTCKGITMKEIGHQLNLSPRTVEMHINNIKKKLHCYSKSELKTLFFKTSVGKKILTALY